MPADASHLRHELRTPVNHLIGYADLLVEEGDVTPELAAGLDSVRELARDVLGVVAGVIDADSRVSAAAVEALHGLVALLESATAPLAPLATPAQRPDVAHLVTATGRLRELVSSLRSGQGASAEPPRGASEAPTRAADRRDLPLVLVVDDDAANREVLVRRVQRLGYAAVEAADGREALDLMRTDGPDVVLLDVMMPVLDGYAVLEERRGDPTLRDIPVIMISALDQVESVVRCIEAGAEDYLPKPFDPVLLKARVSACIEKKRLRDAEKSLLATVSRQAAELRGWNVELERRVAEKTEEVARLSALRRFVSPQLADIILSSGEDLLQSHRREVTVVFCDMRGFTAFAETAEPEDVMRVLAEYHRALGELIFAHGGTLEQFQGDGLMVFFNDPVPCNDPAWTAVQMAIAMRESVRELADGWRRHGHQIDFGVGIAIGYATCGRIGFEGRYDYAAIGTVTNTAARLCAEAKGGQILVSERVRALVEGRATVEAAGELTLKGIARPVPAFNVTGVPEPSP